jgi:PAS domain S-box-containing protein
MATILVVDHDLPSRQRFVSLLTPFGHQVMEAGDGKEGLEQARLRNPNLIITNILMPRMNGYEFVTALRKLPSLELVPVIFQSATFVDLEARSVGAACGVSLFIMKPCEPENALIIIHQALDSKVEPPAPSPSVPSPSDAIPLLIDAFFEQGKQLDEVSVRLASLLSLGLDLAHSHGLEILLDKAGKAAKKIIGANYSGIGILAGEGTLLRSFSFFGGSPDVAAGFVGSNFSGLIFKEIVSERKARRAFDPSGEHAALELPAGHPPLRSFLGAPLRTQERVYGWIYVADKLANLEFTEEDSRILTAIAVQVALAFENAERFRTIHEHARQMETEIQERELAEDRFRALVQTAPTGIFIADEKGCIIEVNTRALSMFGYDDGELIGENIEILIPERLRNSHRAHRAAYVKKPHARAMGAGMELVGRRKDGTEFPAEISLGPLITKKGVLVSSTVVDISERKKMEKQLRLSQRMEAIGELAGGVAHDFNNLLAVILGCADVVLDALPPGQPTAKKVEMIRQAGSSAADLTRQLLAFSRQQMLQPRVVELKEVVNRTHGLLCRLIGENIEIRISLDPSVGCVKADPGQIEQVILNLAVNARDAMPQGGQLTIQAHNVEIDDSYRGDHVPVAPGRYVMVAVEDTGCGMDRQTQSRIFDPFFTTKEIGKGTGMGLATVYGIVKQSGGYIWVYSELNKGTIFKIYLPLVDQSPQPLNQEEPETVVLRGCETILLAEDSDSLREMAREYLESLGYTVVEAASGAEALQKAKDFAGTIHMLLTDVVMPEMSGPELASEMASLRPGIKIIFTSGYTDDAIARHGVLNPAVAFIQKPYRPKALTRKIREVLGEPAIQAESIFARDAEKSCTKA